jgi:hypothetical protein
MLVTLPLQQRLRKRESASVLRYMYIVCVVSTAIRRGKKKNNVRFRIKTKRITYKLSNSLFLHYRSKDFEL